MTHESRRLAGILLIVLPTVMFGGLSILSLLIGDPTYMKNPLRQDLWLAGHAHAGVWLILALVALRYVDEANLSDAMKWIVRGAIPVAAILVPAAFFLSVLSPNATAPNGLIYLAYVGAALLALGVVVRHKRSKGDFCELPSGDSPSMSADGTFRASHLHRRMSAIGGKADMTLTQDNVR